MTYYQDQQARSDFIARHARYSAVAQSIMLGDAAQITKDVERGRIDAAVAVLMAREAAKDGIITALKATQIEQRLRAAA